MLGIMLYWGQGGRPFNKRVYRFTLWFSSSCQYSSNRCWFIRVWHQTNHKDFTRNIYKCASVTFQYV